MSDSTELAILPAALSPAVVFAPGGVEDILAQVRARVADITKDISTPENRQKIKSAAHKIARSKTLLDDMGKELVADLKAQTNKIDAERKRIRDDLDALKEEVRRPLTEWEEAEKGRVAAHEESIEAVRVLCLHDADTVEAVDGRLAQLEAYAKRDWEEFRHRFEGHYGHVKDVLTGHREAIIQREAEKAELARLRAEEEARKQKEREEQIAREAAEKAKREAEEAAAKAAKEQAEREEAERRRIQAEAEARERAERAAREKAEREAAEKLAAEQRERERAERERRDAEARAVKAEADAKAAAEKAERDRIEAERLAAQREKEAKEKAERDAQAAVEAERQRVAAQQAKEKAEAEAREKDKKHKASVNNAAVVALSKEAAISEDTAKAVITAIAKGLIPNVKISY